jgi:hypothetical protein
MPCGRATAVAALAIVASAIGPDAASAHGPCDCLSPASGPAGMAVSAAYPAYKVVFNPDRTDLGIGPKSLWRDHRAALAPSVVFRKTYRYSDLPLKGPVQFKVPGAPPGRYLVSIYDGGEGGAHYTWEYFQVTAGGGATAAARAPSPLLSATREATRVSLFATVLVAVAALLTGLLLGGLATRLRQRSRGFRP